VTVERTLRRVDEDLRNGDLVMARTRLRDQVRSLPQRLDLRERLAEVYRLEGDVAQAGRWSFLAEKRDPAELEAFTRAYRRDPETLMQAIAWRGDEGDATTEVARERLTELRTLAESKTGRPLGWSDKPYEPATSSWSDRVVGFGCVVGALAVAAVLVTGLVTILDWITSAF
jgi:hypothetical protein